MLRTRRARRVLASRRRGSSWPVVLDTDGGRYFTKLVGAGQGSSALVAEVIVAGIAERLGLRVPDRAFVSLDADVELECRDPELVELLAASRGLNLGFEPIAGARDLRPEDLETVSRDDASTVAWLDWLVMNPDRTWRSPNLLIRKGDLWLIDHGSALVFHHDWPAVTEDSPRRALPWFSSHALAARATAIAEWDPLLAESLDREVLRDVVQEVPDDFLRPLLPFSANASALARRREAYAAFLWKRLKPPRPLPLLGRAA
jgi:hypothetical protein